MAFLHHLNSGVAVGNSRELISPEHQSIVTFVIDKTEQETFDSIRYFCEADLEGKKIWSFKHVKTGENLKLWSRFQVFSSSQATPCWMDAVDVKDMTFENK